VSEPLSAGGAASTVPSKRRRVAGLATLSSVPGQRAGGNDQLLWICPRCARTFAAHNQTHTCRQLGDLDRHFAGKDPAVRQAFDAVLAEVRRLGPVSVLPQSTRIALHVRMSFAAFVPRRHWLDGHVVLARRLDSSRFRRIEEYSPRNVLHAFRLPGPDDVDAEVVSWLAEAYRVGRQDHLGSIHEG
jgi:Domain of unknown function (DUF5655)